MNPFDAMNSDVSKNKDNSVQVRSQSNKSNANHATSSNASSKSMKLSSRSARVHKSQSRPKSRSKKLEREINLLKNQYSTARLNKYDVIRLKILQKISGDNSRSDLINKMIGYTKPIILNSKANRKEYKSLLNYAVKGAEINNKFNK